MDYPDDSLKTVKIKEFLCLFIRHTKGLSSVLLAMLANKLLFSLCSLETFKRFLAADKKVMTAVLLATVLSFLYNKDGKICAFGTILLTVCFYEKYLLFITQKVLSALPIKFFRGLKSKQISLAQKCGILAYNLIGETVLVKILTFLKELDYFKQNGENESVEKLQKIQKILVTIKEFMNVEESVSAINSIEFPVFAVVEALTDTCEVGFRAE